jgi:hypothetical protein
VFFKVSPPLLNITCPALLPPRNSVHRLQLVRGRRVPSCRVDRLASYLPLSEARESRAPRLGNFDTKQPTSYCYKLPTQHRLESVANAHTAADLHVRPWVSNRADLESRGRRERLRNTLCVSSDNPLNRRSRTSLRRCCRAAIAKLQSKFLNPCTESRAPGSVTNLAALAKNFHKIFTFDLARPGFRTAWTCYAGK